jgi:DNA polymerase-3 subunit alpha
MEHSFIHLHNHSEYSVLDGAAKTAALVEAAYQNKMPAVALTDHGNIFGAVTFFREAKAREIKPILGCETYVAPRSRLDKTGDSRDPHHFHLVLLVKNDQGYRNLCYLLSKAYLEGFYYRPRIDKELLSGHTDGLIGLSSCLKGEVSYYLERENEAAAEKAAGEYASLFGRGDFYLEIQDHGLPPQKSVNPKLVGLAARLGLPLVATNDIHYLRKEDSEAHDILLCIQTNKKLSDQDRIRFGSQEFYFKSGAEMAELFKEVPEALQNTTHIASQCHFDFPAGGHFLPQFKAPGEMPLDEYLALVAKEGFKLRLEVLGPKWEKGELAHPIEDYQERLERELRLINQVGFEGYFLIVWDLIQMARSRDIRSAPAAVGGRKLPGLLPGITEVDPLEYDLLFERFSTPSASACPTSTSISAPGAAVRSLITSRTSMAGRMSPRSSPSGRWRPGRPSGMSDACSRSPCPRWTGSPR